MKTISAAIESVEKIVSIISIFAIALILIAAVFFRYFLQAPLFWAGEVSIFLMVWISFLGGSLGLKRKSQAAVLILVDKLSDKWQKIVSISIHIIMIVFLFILLYYSYQWVFSSNVAFQKSTALRMPMWIAYSSVPVGLTFATIHLFSHFIEILRGGEK